MREMERKAQSRRDKERKTARARAGERYKGNVRARSRASGGGEGGRKSSEQRDGGKRDRAPQSDALPCITVCFYWENNSSAMLSGKYVPKVQPIWACER